MHGNVAEWTRSEYRPYPYRDSDGQNQLGSFGKKVVRGGSWYDRPDRCRSAFRQAYPACQPVYDVGFRVICEADGDRPGEANWHSPASCRRPSTKDRPPKEKRLSGKEKSSILGGVELSA